MWSLSLCRACVTFEAASCTWHVALSLNTRERHVTALSMLMTHSDSISQAACSARVRALVVPKATASWSFGPQVVLGVDFAYCFIAYGPLRQGGLSVAREFEPLSWGRAARLEVRYQQPRFNTKTSGHSGARSNHMGSGSVTVAAVLVVMLAAAGIRCTNAQSLRANHADGCKRRLLWFMATTTKSSLEYWRYGKGGR